MQIRFPNVTVWFYGQPAQPAKIFKKDGELDCAMYLPGLVTSPVPRGWNSTKLEIQLNGEVNKPGSSANLLFLQIWTSEKPNHKRNHQN